MDRPVAVVEVQDRVDLDQVHVGLVIGVERADVAPVGGLLAVLVTEGVGEDPGVGQHRRDDVLAEVVPAGLLPGGVLEEELVHFRLGEDIIGR